MELYQEILIKALQQQTVEVTFPNLTFNPKEIVEMECYRALTLIKQVLDDDRLNDRTCFQYIERILEAFETLGCKEGSRHDFG